MIQDSRFVHRLGEQEHTKGCYELFIILVVGPKICEGMHAFLADVVVHTQNFFLLQLRGGLMLLRLRDVDKQVHLQFRG